MLNYVLINFFIVYLIFYGASGGVCSQSQRNCEDVLITEPDTKDHQMSV